MNNKHYERIKGASGWVDTTKQVYFDPAYFPKKHIARFGLIVNQVLRLYNHFFGVNFTYSGLLDYPWVARNSLEHIQIWVIPNKTAYLGKAIPVADFDKDEWKGGYITLYRKAIRLTWWSYFINKAKGLEADIENILFRVLMHETGHVLGTSHTLFNPALMNGTNVLRQENSAGFFRWDIDWIAKYLKTNAQKYSPHIVELPNGDSYLYHTPTDSVWRLKQLKQLYPKVPVELPSMIHECVVSTLLQQEIRDVDLTEFLL